MYHRLWLSLCLLVLLSYSSYSQEPSGNSLSLVWKPGYLDIHHINTGRGNATFCVLPDGTTMLIDAGDMVDSQFAKYAPLTITKPYPDGSKTSAQWIVDYIKQALPLHTLPAIDYALITHFHGDHFGAISGNTKWSENAAYQLSGITEVGDLLKIGTFIDRNYPDYNFPVNLQKAYADTPNNFTNLLKFINWQKNNNGMKATHLEVGTTEQVVLKIKRQSYPGFAIRGIKSNGTIWTGEGTNTIDYFTKDSVIEKNGRFNENPLSLALTINYGMFNYFTGGDNTGLSGYGLPHWFDVETPMAKAVGKVDVAVLDHHGNRDAVNENFLLNLKPQVIVQQAWCSDQPGQEVLHRIISDHLYPGEKNVFATSIQESTKQTLGFWLTKGYKSMMGHIIIRVSPGGDSFTVMTAETKDNIVKVTRLFGPYFSK